MFPTKELHLSSLRKASIPPLEQSRSNKGKLLLTDDYRAYLQAIYLAFGSLIAIRDAHSAPSFKKLSAHLDRICTNYTYI